MKKNNTNKKLFSAIATLALSTSAICGAVSFAGCGDKSSYVPSETVNHGSYTTISTALGATTSKSSGVKYYASPDATPNNTENDGSMERPYHIGDLLDENSEKYKDLKPGDTVYLLPGTYSLVSRIRLPEALSGTYDKYIRIVNAAMEKEQSGYTGTDTHVVLDFSAQSFASTNRGIEIYGDYIHWYGIDVCGAGDNGLYVGGSYNTIEYSEFYNNRDSGLQLGRSYSEYNSIKQWPSFNLVKNCTSHNNYDNETYGENADGFAAKLTVGYGNVFDGCIAYRNSDDGWDLYAKVESGNIGAVIMYNCVAFENGYLEYTRDECNAYFPTYNKDIFDKNETSTNPYKTRDGDGNGFKLGGSVMEGDVVLYNCLAYFNRMHGVTDNSNPGFIKSTGVTSYDNSAAVNENGQIISTTNDDNHSNIDVSRHAYSFNTVNNTISVRDSLVPSLDKDNYRGSVSDSLLDASKKTNVIKGSINADTLGAGGKTYTSQIDVLDASAMFKQLPVVMDADGNYTYNLDGAREAIVVKDGKLTSELKPDRVHVKYRNEDMSINMRDILAKSDAAEALIDEQLGEDTWAGSELNKTGWSEYKHFFADDLMNDGAASSEEAIVDRTIEALTLNCDENAVYQDFEIPTEMIDSTIEWTSSNEEFLKIDTSDIEVSPSGSKYAMAIVYRDSVEDKTVKLTAKVTCGSVSKEKEFTLVIKQGDPSIGDIYTVDMNGERVDDGGRYIVDMYRVYKEPEVKVKNGLYWDSDKLLKESEYTVSTVYMYQTDSNAPAIRVKGFTQSVAGVYTITNTVTLKNDTTKKNTMTYKIYVASVSAQVAFTSDPVVSVYQDGFKIAGEPSSATGKLYAVSSATPLELTKDNIKSATGVVSKDFRDTSISFEFANANNGEYYVYFALANANDEITSEVYSVKINKVEIDTAEKFMKVAGGEKLGDEVPSQTIYMLTGDIDFTGVEYKVGKANFTGVLNGLGHTVSNLTISTDKTDKNVGVFYKVAGGTLMNVKFDNISITAEKAGEKVGLVSECTGGYFYNLAFTNYNIKSTKRVGGLIGHVGGTTDGKGTVYPLYISQISIVNDAEHKIAGTQRVAGLIGYVQHYRNSISIDNCYVRSDIDAGSTGEGSGMVASWEDNYAVDSLRIERCYYAGTLKTAVAPGSSRLGGMLGYHKGGAGKLVITRCISLAILDIQGEIRTNSVKNASPIVGNYSGNADVSVTKCIGLMQEYNSNYDSEVFNETNLRRHSEYIESEGYLNLDTKTRWSIVVADEEDKSPNDLYKAPYVVLNFLGNWN